MLSNNDFLNVVKESFKDYLEVNTSRSTKKLEPLHGAIARDLQEVFGEGYTVMAKGFEKGKEYKAPGKYYEKNVDITIIDKANEDVVACYEVKFVMRNYQQNSNNYFLSMLGETANIRANNIPCFEIFLFFDKLPYFKKDGELARFENVNDNNLAKYFTLSDDSPNDESYVPDKMLVLAINLKENENIESENIRNDKEYCEYYLAKLDEDNELVKYSNKISDKFGEVVILNDYQKFILESYNISLSNED